MSGLVEARPAPVPARAGAGEAREPAAPPSSARAQGEPGRSLSRPGDPLGAMLARAVRQRSATLQRAKVTGTENFVSQKHHPIYSFAKDDGEAKVYDLDAWIRQKHKPAARRAHIWEQKDVVAREVAQALTAWDGKSSIIGELAARLTSSPLGDSWSDTTVPDVLAGTAGGWDLVQHLLVLKRNIAMREGDIDANVPSKITLAYTRKIGNDKKGSESIVIDWLAVLERARLKLRDVLLAAQPAKPPEKNKVRLIDDAIKHLWTTDKSLKRMMEVKALIDQGGQVRFKGTSTVAKTDWKTTFAVIPNALEATDEDAGEQPSEAQATSNPKATPKKKPAGKGKQGGSDGDEELQASFNFGMGHLRFIVYLEWRAVYELLDFATREPEAVKEEKAGTEATLIATPSGDGNAT